MMQPNAAPLASEQAWFAQLQSAKRQAPLDDEAPSISLRQAAQRLILAAHMHAGEGRDEVAAILCRSAYRMAKLAESLQ